MASNRLKFLCAGPVLELANPRLPGRPHDQLAHLVPQDARAVLEICAGTGYLSRIAARLRPAATFHALDLSPEILASGRRRAAADGLDRIVFVEGDAGKLPFADDRFDVVMAAFGLHELPTDVRSRAAHEARRVLRPGGVLLVADLDSPIRGARAFFAYMRIAEKPAAREILDDGLTHLLTSADFALVRRTRIRRMPLPFQLVVAQPAT